MRVCHSFHIALYFAYRLQIFFRPMIQTLPLQVSEWPRIAQISLTVDASDAYKVESLQVFFEGSRGLALNSQQFLWVYKGLGFRV